MLADLPLSERQRLAAEDQRETRAALVRSHFETMDGWQLVAGGALAHNLRVADIVDAKLRAKRTLATPATTVLPIEVGTVERPDLRARLGLS